MLFTIAINLSNIVVVYVSVHQFIYITNDFCGDYEEQSKGHRNGPFEKASKNKNFRIWHDGRMLMFCSLQILLLL